MQRVNVSRKQLIACVLIVALALAVPYWKGKVFRGKVAKKGAEEHA